MPPAPSRAPRRYRSCSIPAIVVMHLSRRSALVLSHAGASVPSLDTHTHHVPYGIVRNRRLSQKGTHRVETRGWLGSWGPGGAAAPEQVPQRRLQLGVAVAVTTGQGAFREGADAGVDELVGQVAEEQPGPE